MVWHGTTATTTTTTTKLCFPLRFATLTLTIDSAPHGQRYGNPRRPQRAIATATSSPAFQHCNITALTKLASSGPKKMQPQHSIVSMPPTLVRILYVEPKHAGTL